MEGPANKVEEFDLLQKNASCGFSEYLFAEVDNDPSFLQMTDHWGNTLLHPAVMSGDLPTLKGLVDRGADIHATNHNGETALDWAESTKQTAMVEYLRLSMKIEIFHRLLRRASWNKRPDAQAYLFAEVDKDPSFLQMTDNFGHTLLHAAVNSHEFDTLSGLVDRGADIHAKDNEGKTALDWAVSMNKTAMVEYLRDPM